MSDLETFGPFVIATDVSDAITLTLQTWGADYLGVLNRKLGQPAGWLPEFGSYVVANDPDHWAEDQLPAVVIAIPGTLGTPQRDGLKNYRVEWEARVTVFVSASDRDSTERLAKYYGAVVRLILLGKGGLGGFAAGTTWRGESYSVRVADRDQRTLGSCENRFAVDVRNVVQALNGPLTPAVNPVNPPADWPVATTVKVAVEPEPLT